MANCDNVIFAFYSKVWASKKTKEENFSSSSGLTQIPVTMNLSSGLRITLAPGIRFGRLYQAFKGFLKERMSQIFMLLSILLETNLKLSPKNSSPVPSHCPVCAFCVINYGRYNTFEFRSYPYMDPSKGITKINLPSFEYTIYFTADYLKLIR